MPRERQDGSRHGNASPGSSAQRHLGYHLAPWMWMCFHSLQLLRREECGTSQMAVIADSEGRNKPAEGL